MIKTQISLLLLLVLQIISCTSLTPNKPIYCGYELSVAEFERLQSKAKLQTSAYTADSLNHIYSQLNDSIRAAMPPSVEFEVFMILLNKDEVALDVYFPPKKEYFEKIGCVIMNSKFSDIMPEQRYMCLYTYTNPDGSGDIPFEIAIKRKR
jgi:hypothetical protein